jgi:hypothetical protein
MDGAWGIQFDSVDEVSVGTQLKISILLAEP